LEQDNPKILNIIAIIRKDYRMRYDNNDIAKACSVFAFSPIEVSKKSTMKFWEETKSLAQSKGNEDRIIKLS
jgi:hypothetical protein